MGCGDCESMSRSVTLPVATDDMVLLERIAKQIFGSFHIDVKDVRGVGVQMSRLETVDTSRRGSEKNALKSWLASYGKTSEKGKGTACALNLGDGGEALVTEGNLDPRTQQEDANCQPSCIEEKRSSGPSHVKLSSATSYENRTSMLPELCHLDIEVIKNLPPDIFSEMNDIYNGKLSDFMKKYIDEEGIGNVKLIETMLERSDTSLSSRHQKGGSNTDGNMTGAQISSLEPCPEFRNKGKEPLCSPDHLVCDRPFKSERAQIDFANAPTDSLEKYPGGGRTQSIEKSKINFWLGKPPNWVEMFRVNDCFLLNVVADLYAKSGRSCSLSSVLQSLFSCYPCDFDLSSEGWDEALSSLCELIIQYIDLKIESDIEELYICFRLLKRFTSTSKFLSEVYNIVLPLLQVSVNEHYGGQLQLSFNE